VPVYLVSLTSKAFFFRHTIEDGSCPAQTRGAWSHEQIKAMKYHGAQESDAHRRMKVLLEKKPSRRPSGVRCPSGEDMAGRRTAQGVSTAGCPGRV